MLGIAIRVFFTGPGNKRKPLTPKPEEQGSTKRRRSARTNSRNHLLRQ